MNGLGQMHEHSINDDINCQAPATEAGGGGGGSEGWSSSNSSAATEINLRMNEY